MKISKKIDRELKDLVALLPNQTYQSYVPKIVKGSEILDDPDIPNGEKIYVQPHKDYFQKLPERRPVNHLRRLRRAYKSNGIEGVQKYMSHFKEVVGKKDEDSSTEKEHELGIKEVNSSKFHIMTKEELDNNRIDGYEPII